MFVYSVPFLLITVSLWMGSVPLNEIVLVHWLKLLIRPLYASLYTYFYSKVSHFAVIIEYLKNKCFYLFVAICIPLVLFTEHSGCISFMYMLNIVGVLTYRLIKFS